MSVQVPWNERILNDFIRLACLSEDEAYIMRTRAHGTPVSVQATALNLSESAVAKKIALLKRKYDKVQEEYPEKFPKRRRSARETWLDNN